MKKLSKDFNNDENLSYIIKNIYCMIDGKYEEDKRDVTLHMRGSSNQTIIYLEHEEEENE